MPNKDQTTILGAVEDEDADLADMAAEWLFLNRTIGSPFNADPFENIDKDENKGFKGADPDMVDFFSLMYRKDRRQILLKIRKYGWITKRDT